MLPVGVLPIPEVILFNSPNVSDLRVLRNAAYDDLRLRAIPVGLQHGLQPVLGGELVNQIIFDRLLIPLAQIQLIVGD